MHIILHLKKPLVIIDEVNLVLVFHLSRIQISKIIETCINVTVAKITISKEWLLINRVMKQRVLHFVLFYQQLLLLLSVEFRIWAQVFSTHPRLWESGILCYGSYVLFMIFPILFFHFSDPYQKFLDFRSHCAIRSTKFRSGNDRKLMSKAIEQRKY